MGRQLLEFRQEWEGLVIAPQCSNRVAAGPLVRASLARFARATSYTLNLPTLSKPCSYPCTVRHCNTTDGQNPTSQQPEPWPPPHSPSPNLANTMALNALSFHDPSLNGTPVKIWHSEGGYNWIKYYINCESLRTRARTATQEINRSHPSGYNSTHSLEPRHNIDYPMESCKAVCAISSWSEEPISNLEP